MKKIRGRYRIVTDNYAGFEVQMWSIFWPFWTQVSTAYDKTNTHLTIEMAKLFIENQKNKPKKLKTEVVWTEK